MEAEIEVALVSTGPAYYANYKESVKESPITTQSGEGLLTETLEQVKEETDKPYVLDYQDLL